ncbi:Cytosolic carboxypeptidase-like protein 5 [Nymphon striatum]|nr:Cytosolic carboxypeptidase-like protein 5 [Nymphon striatum]
MKCEINGYIFSSEFDSGNLARIERVCRNNDVNEQYHHHPRGKERGSSAESCEDTEFNAWTKMDCEGTPFQNGNRTWFHFSVKSCHSNALIKINILNLNKQGKLFNYGMAPVLKEVRVSCQGKICQCCQWKRVKHTPKYKYSDGQSILSFIHRLPQATSTLTYFAFTYPFNYAECQSMLNILDAKYNSYSETCNKDLYYHREVLCKSLEGNRVDLITISSHHGITDTNDDLIDESNMFPERKRCRKFSSSKKIIFISSRVHPDELCDGKQEFLIESDNVRMTVDLEQVPGYDFCCDAIILVGNEQLIEAGLDV